MGAQASQAVVQALLLLHGGALFSVILGQSLTGGIDRAFQIVFWWLTGASAVALGSSLWLWAAIRSREPAGALVSTRSPAG